MPADFNPTPSKRAVKLRYEVVHVCVHCGETKRAALDVCTDPGGRCLDKSDHPVEIARQLFIAVNTEEVADARDLHAKLGERLGEPDRYREALKRITEAEGWRETTRIAREALDG